MEPSSQSIASSGSFTNDVEAVYGIKKTLYKLKTENSILFLCARHDPKSIVSALVEEIVSKILKTKYDFLDDFKIDLSGFLELGSSSFDEPATQPKKIVHLTGKILIQNVNIPEIGFSELQETQCNKEIPQAEIILKKKKSKLKIGCQIQ